MSSCDLLSGFYQLQVRPEDTHKLAFTTDSGCYKFLQLPMGLKTGPAAFQRAMNMIFHDKLQKSALIYMDNLMIYSQSIVP